MSSSEESRSAGIHGDMEDAGSAEPSSHSTEFLRSQDQQSWISPEAEYRGMRSRGQQS